MKTFRHSVIPAAAVSVLMSPAFAIEAPEDDAPPPPPLGQDAQQPPAAARDQPAAARDAVAFLGLVSAGVPEVLAAHLDLAPGEGVVVNAVHPGSPAALAGITPHDVILRVADEPIRDPRDLSRVVAAHKPGDVVGVDLFQKGEKRRIDVTLGERPKDMDLMAGGIGDQGMMLLEGLPEDQAARIRDLIEKNLRAMEQPDNPLGFPDIDDAMRQMRERMGQMMDQGINPPDAGGGGIRFQAGAAIRLMDDKGSVEIKTVDGGKEVTVRDKQNEIVWSGPWDTEQDKAAAPEEVRERVGRLNLDDRFGGPGIRFNFRGGNLPPADDE